MNKAATSRGVVDAANELFEALRTDDLNRFQRITGPGFYAFDAGRRFNGNELAVFVRDLHAKGTRFTWSITDPVVHMSCGSAWVTYVNRGAVENDAGRQSVSWLESMFLQYSDSRWHIDFLHSSRVPDPK